jgi:hypothetical protein
MIVSASIKPQRSSVPALPKSTVRMVGNDNAKRTTSMSTDNSTYFAPHLATSSNMTPILSTTAGVSMLTNFAATVRPTSIDPRSNGPEPIISNMAPHDQLEFVAAHFLRQKSAKQVEAEIEQLVQKYEGK